MVENEAKTKILSYLLLETSKNQMDRLIQNQKSTCKIMSPQTLSRKVVDKGVTILLRGGTIRIKLIYEFSIVDATKLASVYIAKPEAELEASAPVDFVREFSNLHSGYIRKILSDLNIRTGVSLPSVFSTDQVSTTTSSLFAADAIDIDWTVKTGDQTLFCKGKLSLSEENLETLLKSDLRGITEALGAKKSGNVEYLD